MDAKHAKRNIMDDMMKYLKKLSNDIVAHHEEKKMSYITKIVETACLMCNYIDTLEDNKEYIKDSNIRFNEVVHMILNDKT